MTPHPTRTHRLAASLLVLTLAAATCGADETSQEPASEDQAKHTLAYQFQPGQEIVTRVQHVATTETTIRGNTQRSTSRSVSTKVWKVLEIDDQGHATFVHSVGKVEMSNKVTGRPEVTYDSETDDEVPADYEFAAKTIGKPLARITVDPHGEIVKREDLRPQIAVMGLGQMITPLPNEPVAIDESWYFPTEIEVRNPDGTIKRIKTRQKYTLRSVKTGVATIDVRTQVLTPVNDPRLESQLVQQVTNGEIRFDVDAGQLISKQMDWDDSVIGFSGPDSRLKFLARFTEETVSASKAVARRQGSSDSQ